MFSELGLPVTYGLKVKETRQERYLQKYEDYQQEWNQHQVKHENFFSSEAMITKYPNPSTYD